MRKKELKEALELRRLDFERKKEDLLANRILDDGDALTWIPLLGKKNKKPWVFKEKFGNLPICEYREKKKKQEKEQCFICKEEYQEIDRIIFLMCFHEFHEDCLEKWYRIHNFCPLCKEYIHFD